MSAVPAAAAEIPLSRRRRWSALRGVGVGGWVSLAVLACLLLVAAVGPLLTGEDPNAVDLSYAYAAPSGDHPLGRDANGRDLLARLIYGARTALIDPLVLVLVATFLGTVLALAAVWYGGWFDSLVSRCVDAIFAFPGLLLAILATALFGAGLTAAVVALAIAYTPYLTRIIRSAALQERALPYVAALRVQGARSIVICIRHILPNIAPIVIANGTLSFGYALMDLAALSFIGLGVQPPTADWGAMVSDGVPGIIQHYPQESIYASILIVASVAAANLLGDRIVGRRETAS
jgi:peptide/nickel transport system permease protein